MLSFIRALTDHLATRFLPIASLLALGWLAPLPASAASKPHIILIYSDDMGVADIGCYGGQLAPTPHLDRMAAEGTRFQQFYVASTICSPSRCGLLTGQHPARWSIHSFLQTKAGNRGCGQADFLDPQAPSLPRQLKAAGYATAHIGKWHLGGGRDVVDAPKFAEYGYDEHCGTYESPEPDPQITAKDWIWSPEDSVKRWNRSAYFVDRTLDFLKRHQDSQPCFVNLWPDDVHTPWIPNEESDKKDTPRNLNPVIIEYDRQIGRLLQGVKDLGLDEQTLILFTSDNGPLPTFQGSRSAPYRGCKLSLYEGGIRMPCIIRWPGTIPAGVYDTETVWSALDLFPSLCQLAGASLPEGYQPAGRDVSRLLQGQRVETSSAPLFWEYGRNDEFYRFPGKAEDRSPWLAIRDGNWKLLCQPDGSSVELYDLSADPHESRNLAADQQDLRERLLKDLLAWKNSLPK